MPAPKKVDEFARIAAEMPMTNAEMKARGMNRAARMAALSGLRRGLGKKAAASAALATMRRR